MKLDDLAATPDKLLEAIAQAPVMPLSKPANEDAPPPPPPRPLPSELLPVPPWDEALLPASLRPWLADVAERMQAPPEYAAVGALVSLGSVIGRQVAIYPKRFDSWNVIPHPWGAVIGPPGVLKSPAIREPLLMLRRLDERTVVEHAAAQLRHEAETSVVEARKCALQERMKKAARLGEESELGALAALAADLAAPPAPQERRHIVNDATPEKLGELLRDNPHRQRCFRDELAGWLRQLEREGREGERAFFLEAWDGHGAYTFDRISRGTTRIDPACVTVFGGIQPGPLRHYIRAALRGGSGDDGLLPRFQLLVYPDVPREFRNVDRRPDLAARDNAQELFRACAELDTNRIGALPEQLGPPSLHFSDEAQELHDEFRVRLEHRLRSGEDAPILAAHLGKFRSLIPALAGVFHVADVMSGTAEPGPIQLEALQLALRWAAFLEGHALRVYGLALHGGVSAAYAIRKKLLEGKLPGTFSARDIYVQGWAGLTDPDEVREGLDMLEHFGWLQAFDIRGAGGGRPTTHYEWTPGMAERVL